MWEPSRTRPPSDNHGSSDPAVCICACHDAQSSGRQSVQKPRGMPLCGAARLHIRRHRTGHSKRLRPALLSAMTTHACGVLSRRHLARQLSSRAIPEADVSGALRRQRRRHRRAAASRAAGPATVVRSRSAAYARAVAAPVSGQLALEAHVLAAVRGQRARLRLAACPCPANASWSVGPHRPRTAAQARAVPAPMPRLLALETDVLAAVVGKRGLLRGGCCICGLLCGAAPCLCLGGSMQKNQAQRCLTAAVHQIKQDPRTIVPSRLIQCPAPQVPKVMRLCS